MNTNREEMECHLGSLLLHTRANNDNSNDYNNNYNAIPSSIARCDWAFCARITSAHRSSARKLACASSRTPPPMSVYSPQYATLSSSSLSHSHWLNLWAPLSERAHPIYIYIYMCVCVCVFCMKAVSFLFHVYAFHNLYPVYVEFLFVFLFACWPACFFTSLLTHTVITPLSCCLQDLKRKYYQQMIELARNDKKCVHILAPFTFLYAILVLSLVMLTPLRVYALTCSLPAPNTIAM